MNDTATYGWVFHQDLEGKWCAAKREHYFELFNGEKGNVLKSTDINVLVSLINKTGGDKAEIQKLLDVKENINSPSDRSFFFHRTNTIPEAY